VERPAFLQLDLYSNRNIRNAIVLIYRFQQPAFGELAFGEFGGCDTLSEPDMLRTI
jgi:hypothetical protein